MWQLLESLENTGFSTWVRETPTVLAYPTVLAIHAFGMAFLVGLSTMIALRVLGYASDIPLAPMGKLYRLIHFGFWLAAISGLVLLAQAATTFVVMPIFYIKLLAIAAAIVCIRRLRTVVFEGNADRRPISGEARFVSSLMLALWGVAIICGRLTAYAWNPIGWQSIIAILIALTVVLVALRIGGRMMAPESRPADIRTSTGTGY